MILPEHPVSATITAAAHHPPRRFRSPPSDPAKVRVYEWSVAIPTIAALVYFVVGQWGEVSSDTLELLLWSALVIPIDLMPISYSDEIHQTTSEPILLAAGMALPFYEVALLAFVACWDPRELRGKIGIGRALFNRSQMALSIAASSFVFHFLGGDVTKWPSVWGVALIAVGTSVLSNWATVITAAKLMTALPLKCIMRDVLLDSPVQYALSYLGFCLLALVFAFARESVGLWGLVAAVIPMALGRQMFLLRKKSAQASTQVAEKDQVIVKISEQIEDERREERARVAASLHDEVLPALFKVHLMGEVLRQDLDSGRLLALEDDIPELRQAADDATRLVRALVRDLRRSAIGVGGLASTLQLLIDELAASSNVRVNAELEDINGLPSLQLVIYQVAREALMNSFRHSGARRISIRLFRDASEARLIVADDGVGFMPGQTDPEKHFGLQLMAERVELADGVLRIETRPGEGTEVVARFPIEYHQ
jgi:signal transduction histidine kinase